MLKITINLVKILRAYALGVSEGYQNMTTGITYDDDPESPRSEAYDRGRNMGEIVFKVKTGLPPIRRAKE